LREWPNWALLLVRLTVAIGVSALMTWAGHGLGGGDRGWTLLAFVFSVPVIGVAIARPLVELTHEGMSWLWHQPMEKWQGRYYNFNGTQIRVLDEDDRLWFCVEDMLRACQVRAIASILPDTREVDGLHSMDIETVERFHETHRNKELGRFLLWAKREVIEPYERKKTGSLIPR
jgi:hypothetical protein